MQNPKYLRYPTGGFNVQPPLNSKKYFTGYNRDNLRAETRSTDRYNMNTKRLPRNIGGVRKKKLFKEIGHILGSISSVKNILGNVEGSSKQIQKLLTKERKKFLQNVNKSGTQVKKLIEQKGGSLKQAIVEKNKHIEKEKENMRKLLLKSQLHALIELNSRL